MHVDKDVDLVGEDKMANNEWGASSCGEFASFFDVVEFNLF